MPAYVIYARKSTESEDRQVLSIDSQINELKAIAMRRGIHVADVLTESRSAKAPGRPVFSELMRRIHKGSVTGILAWKMDRLARNHLDTGHVLQALADGKIAEVITSDRTYTSDGNDRFMGSFELGMATKFIDDLRANVKRGIRARHQRGWVNHHPALGYMIDPTTKNIIKDPQRYDLVRRMWDLVLDGAHRPPEVLRIANEQWGFRTRQQKRQGGNPLARAPFYRILSNPFYTGVIRLRNGETFPGAHPAMVTREEFERVQKVLGRPGRARPKHHQFAYTGILTCGNCGGGITAEEHVKPSGKRYTYYRCSRTRAHVVCKEKPLSEPELERQVKEQLRVLEMPEKVLSWLCNRVQATFAADEARRSTTRESLERSITALDRERGNLVTLRLRDLVDDDAFIAQKQRIDQNRERFIGKLGVPPLSLHDSAALTVKTFRFAARASEVYSNGSAVQRRMIMEAVGLNYVLKSKKVLYDLKNPLRIIAEAGSCHNWWSCGDDVRTWIEDRTEDFRIPDEIMPPIVHIAP